jgi:transcriptional regulator with XRE-family HTH domain
MTEEMTMAKVSTFADRLREAIKIRNETQTELSRRTGISKSSISRYLKGDWEGKQEAVYALALTLDVSEAWLMGFDAKMERASVKPVTEISDGLDDDVRRLLGELPPDKRQNVADYIRFLANKE